MRVALAAIFFCFCAFSQDASLPPEIHKPFLDNNGKPLNGGLIYTCVASTACTVSFPGGPPSNPQTTYQDKGETTPNTNPVVLDYTGWAPIRLASGENYKIVAQDRNHVQLWTLDNVQSSSITNLLGVANGIATLDGNAHVPQNQLAYVGAGQTTTIAAKLAALPRDLKADFAAVGDGSHDDTAAIQACLNYADANRTICTAPAAQYKVTSGLSIVASGSLIGYAPSGLGQAQFIWYGTGNALTVGTDVGSYTYAPVLSNLAIIPAASVNSGVGINVLGVSECHWTGLEISGAATGGNFQTALRFVDSDIISIDGLIISNPAGITGTTAVLYDEAGGLGFGNTNIVISHADMYFETKMFDIKTCDSCRVVDSTNIEAFDYLLNFDNSTTGSSTNDFNSFWFTGNSVTSDQNSTFTVHKLLNINAVASHSFYLYKLVMNNNRFECAGGTTYPFVITVGTSPSAGYLNFELSGNSIIAADTAVVNVVSQFAFAHLFFGPNHVNNTTNTARTPDVVPYVAGTNTYYIDEVDIRNSTFSPLAYKDVNGVDFRAGSSSNSMTRPAWNAAVPGSIIGTDVATNLNSDGFLRIGTNGGLGSAVNASYCDFSGFSSVSDMAENIVCFTNGSEILRMDSTGVKATGPLTSTGLVTGTGFKAGSSTGFSGTFTCPGGQHVNSLTIVGGIITSTPTCN